MSDSNIGITALKVKPSRSVCPVRLVWRYRRCPSGIPVLRPKSPLHRPTVLLEPHVVPLVVEFLPPADADLYLDLSALEVHPERYQGQAPFLGLTVEALDLPFVHEEFADAKRILVLPVAVRV